MEFNPRKYRVPSTAITEKGIKKLLRDAIKASSQSQWAADNEITPQAVSAFLNETQSAGLQIPGVFGYRPQTIYLPVDEELICHQNPIRRVTKKPTSKTSRTKPPLNKKGYLSNDREETKKRLKARKA